MSNLSEEKIIHSLKYLVEEYNRVTQLYGDFFISKTEIDEIQGLLDLYNKQKEKNKKAIDILNKHIQHCKQEAEGSLNNEVCNIALKFDKHLLQLLKGE